MDSCSSLDMHPERDLKCKQSLRLGKNWGKTWGLVETCGKLRFGDMNILFGTTSL